MKPALSTRTNELLKQRLKPSPNIGYEDEFKVSLAILVPECLKMLSSIFEQFVKESPASVMAQALMSHTFAPERMDGLFRRHAQVQLGVSQALVRETAQDSWTINWHPIKRHWHKPQQEWINLVWIVVFRGKVK